MTYSVNPTTNYSVHPERLSILSQVHPSSSLMQHPEFRSTSVLPLTIELRADKGITIVTGVSNWADKLSGGSNTIAQATVGFQPAFSATGGPFGLPCVTPDGVDDLLTGAFALVQPEEVFAVIKWNVAFDVLHSVAFDGATLNKMLLFRASAAGVSIHAGSTIPGNPGQAVQNWNIYRCFYGAAASHVDNDNAAGPVANAGTNDAGGLTIGATGGATVNGNVSVAHVAIAPRPATPTEALILVRAMGLRCGIAVA